MQKAMAPNVNASVGSINCSNCLLFERDLSGHGENCRRGAPHSPTFPTKDCKVRFEKTPPWGIWPSSLLNDKFKVQVDKVGKEHGNVTR